MRVMKYASLAVVLILLFGCSSMGLGMPHAEDMGGGRYSVTGTTPSGDLRSARQAAALQANEFCGSSSRQAVIENFADKASGDAWGTPASSAIFYCK
jgi:hypothetical protein